MSNIFHSRAHLSTALLLLPIIVRQKPDSQRLLIEVGWAAASANRPLRAARKHKPDKLQ
ncbi:MAG: hypothetical protein RJS97_16340 [Parvibaculaceae bacterium]